MNVATTLIQRLEANPTGICLEFDGNAFTSKQALGYILARAEELTSLGFGKGDRILVGAGRGGRYWCDVVAIWAIGATYVPLDADTGSISLFRKLGVRAAIGADKSLLESVPDVIVLDGDLAHKNNGRVSFADLEPQAESTLLFTSGSTGEPKAVSLSHKCILGNALATLEKLPYGPGEKMFVAIPFRFVSTLSHFLVTLLADATFAGTELRLAPANLAAQVASSKATAFGGGPMQLRWMVSQPQARTSRLRWAMSSGDHLGTDLISELRGSWPGLQVHTVYGMTELGGRICVLPPEEVDGSAGSVGWPIEGLSVAIRDDFGSEVRLGEVGHVYVSGDYEMTEYIDREDATRETKTKLGIRTGDLGRLDDYGRLWLSGRSDDVFKVMGQKVSPYPIIEAMMETRMVSDAAIIAASDKRMGTAVQAYYVANKDIKFDRATITRLLRKRVPAHHIPIKFVELDNIPRTGSGKIDRKLLAMVQNDGQ